VFVWCWGVWGGGARGGGEKGGGGGGGGGGEEEKMGKRDGKETEKGAGELADG